jgi:hypothetical protein
MHVEQEKATADYSLIIEIDFLHRQGGTVIFTDEQLEEVNEVLSKGGHLTKCCTSLHRDDNGELHPKKERNQIIVIPPQLASNSIVYINTVPRYIGEFSMQPMVTQAEA